MLSFRVFLEVNYFHPIKMSTIDAEWIEGASKVLVEGGRAMCVSEIELAISKAGLLSRQ